MSDNYREILVMIIVIISVLDYCKGPDFWAGYILL